MVGMSVTPARPCCCFHRAAAHDVSGGRPICFSCVNIGPSRWFPHNHPYVPEPELLPVVPKPKPGDPPWDMKRERLDLLFAAMEGATP